MVLYYLRVYRLQSYRLFLGDTYMQRNPSSNKGFSLVELIIVISIMAVLIGILTPRYISYIHKSKVATDWANLKAYYSEIETDYVDNDGTYNPDVPTISQNLALTGMMSTVEERLNSWTDAPLNLRPGTMQ